MVWMRRLLSTAATVICASFFGTAHGNATTYVATMSGQVNLTQGAIALGEAAIFTLTFDDGTPGGGDPIAVYSSPTLISWTMKVGGATATGIGGNIIIWNDFNGRDRFAAEVAPPGVTGPLFSGWTPYSAQFGMFDDQGSVYDSVALSHIATASATATDFEQRFLQLRFINESFNFNIVQASITDFSISPNEVPLPAALPLFATILAGGGLIAWRRRRKVKTNA